MKPMRSRSRWLALPLLVLTTATAAAQSDAPLQAVGSGQFSALVEQAAGQTDTPLVLTVNGTTRGLAAFCAGEADMTLATRAMTRAEEAACNGAGVAFTEALIGYDALAFAVAADSPVSLCLTAADLNTLFAPSAAGNTVDWAQVNPAQPSLPLTALVPADGTPAFALLDSLVEGDAFRGDAGTPTAAEALAALAETPGTIAAVPLAAITDTSTVRVLQFNGGLGCTRPTAESIADESYTAAAPLFIYTRAERAADAAALLGALTSAEADPLLSTALFTRPNDAERAISAAALGESRVGRVFSRPETTFSVSPAVSGAVVIAGSPAARLLMDAVTAAFGTQFVGITLTPTFDGAAAGYDALCADTADLVFTTVERPETADAACAAAGIVPVRYDLGRAASVLVRGENSPYLECLTPDVLAQAWSAAPEPPATWNAIDPAFAEDAITLFAPTEGSDVRDLFILSATGASNPLRDDIQGEDSADLRTAAVGNVPGGLALLTWNEYTQRAVDGVLTQVDGDRVLPVAIDAGAGCVLPTEASIADGTYMLARPLALEVNRLALAEPAVQALVWYLSADERLAELESQGFVGLTRENLADRRSSLETLFLQATAEAEARTLAAQATPEATPDATAEAAADAAPEGTPEATPAS